MGDRPALRSEWIPEVQVLRGVAVLMVVAYHAGLPYTGGFVGVDVFLVISGFVIFRRLREQHRAAGRISLRSFYRGRFARLMPALAVMIAAVVALSAVLEDPESSQPRTSATALMALLGVSNLYLAVEAADYFAESSETNPLLHTWSLGVEEQFYLLMPVVVAAVLGARSKRSLAALAVVPAVLSLVGVLGVSRGAWDVPLLGFFSPLGRLWEFGLGVAAAAVPRRTAAISGGTRFVGVAIRAALTAVILLSGAMLDAEDVIPGPRLLPATVATAVILWLSTAAPRGGAGAGRGWRRFLGAVGDRSYSIYLWHWPFIVFVNLLWGSDDLLLPAALLSFVAAEASYRVLEPNGRRRSRAGPIRPGRVLVPAVALIVLSVSGATTSLLHGLGGAPRVVNPGDTGQETFHAYISASYTACEPEELRRIALRWGQHLRCAQSRPGDPTVILIGDSHAEHLFPGLAAALPEETVAYYIRGELPVPGSSPEFDLILRVVAEASAAHTIIVAAHWDGRGVPEGELEGVLRQFGVSGRRVIVTDDVPTFGWEARECHRETRLLLPRIRCEMPRQDHLDRRTSWETGLLRAASRSGAVLVPTADLFCRDDVCSMASRGLLLYRDYNHLNLQGSGLVGEVIAGFVRSPSSAMLSR